METDRLTLCCLCMLQSWTWGCWLYKDFHSPALKSGTFCYHDIGPAIQTWLYCDKCHLLILMLPGFIVRATPQQGYVFIFLLHSLVNILSSLANVSFISGLLLNKIRSRSTISLGSEHLFKTSKISLGDKSQHDKCTCDRWCVWVVKNNKEKTSSVVEAMCVLQCMYN